MTGFGSSEKGAIRVEVRSLNHRFLEIIIKAPPQMGRHEIPLRNILRERFKRGRFEVFVSRRPGENVNLRVNKALAKQIHEELTSLRDELSLKGEIGIEEFSAWRELFIEEAEPDALSIYDAFDEAVSEAEKMRLAEGVALMDDISKRAALIDSINEKVASMIPEAMEKAKKGFMEKLGELMQGPEEGRLMEVASLVLEKSDITEEVTRIKSHIGHLGRILSDGGAVGRKLDFLLQELNREANTIASKAQETGIIDLAVEMKTEIERIREQAQNLQ